MNKNSPKNKNAQEKNEEINIKLLCKKREPHKPIASPFGLMGITKKNLNSPFNQKVKNEEDNSSRRLKREFFLSDVVELAKNLVGKIIVRIVEGVEIYGRIVEAEAYKAPEDKACHAYNNKKSERTKYFWQIGGCLYIYMIHNVNCLNITAASAEEPEAVLIRAIEPIKGIEKIKELRKWKVEEKMTNSKLRELTNGPGKVGGALSFDRSHNGIDLCTDENAYIIDDPEYKFEIERSVRINVDYAGEWKYKPWRFFIKNNQYVSKVKIPYEFIEN